MSAFAAEEEEEEQSDLATPMARRESGPSTPVHISYRRSISTVVNEEFNPSHHKMMVMDFHDFSVAGKIPHYYEAVCKPFEEVMHKDGLSRGDWLVIFVSHRWCQGEHGFEVDQAAKRRRGAPDTDESEKYDLIVEAVEKIIAKIGNNPRVALWLDYSCIEQRDHNEAEVERRNAGFMVRPTEVEVEVEVEMEVEVSPLLAPCARIGAFDRPVRGPLQPMMFRFVSFRFFSYRIVLPRLRPCRTS